MNNGSGNGGTHELSARIAAIAAASKARSQAGEAILGNTLGSSKESAGRPRHAQVSDSEDEMEELCAQDIDRGQELAEEAASDEAEEESESEGSRSQCSASLSEDDWSPVVGAKIEGTNETALILERLILTTGFGQTDKPAVEQLLLRVRSARFWVQVVKQVRAPARRVLTASLNSANVPLPPANPMLRMLNGRLSLYEALTALGPMWSLPAQNLKCVAQRRLNELCSSKSEECHFNSVTVLLRSGASLLSTDGRGRLPAHLASSAGTHMALQLLVRLLQLAPATLLIEDDEGATPLGLLARAPLLQKVIESEDAEQAIILTQFSSGGLLSQLSDAALTCAAALPQQTTRLLQQSPEAARAWRVLASAGGGRAALLLAPERMDESLEDLTWQAEEREGQAAARLRQGLQRIMVLQSIASVSEQKIDALEPQELRLRLAHLEKVAQQQREEASAASALLEAENRQLKRSLADKEDELVMLSSKLEQRASAVDSELVTLTPKQAARIKEADAKLGHFESHERAVIEDIRKARLADVDADSLPEDLRRGVLEMRRSLTAAVDRLARDLYESQAHFLQELLQNADDNNYTEGILPKLDLVLRGRPPDSHLAPYFFAANNEVGLTEVDVRALCDISRSSKTQAGTTTGYKGVGWKSVFRVCETPHVLSQKWRFRFSSSGLGMLTPTWLSEEDLRRLPSEVLDAHQRGETVFYLPLADPGSSLPSIRTEMQTMEADFAQLLFLRRVMQISLRGDFTANAGDSMVVMSAQLSHTGLRTSTSCQVFKKEEHSYGLESEQTTSFEVNSHEDVVVALPLVLDANPPPQRVFAFLPVRSVGFRFAIQAPFHLTASRADLHRSPENLRRRNAIAPAFIKACQQKFDIASHALEYLGTEPAEPFWMPVRQHILEELRNLACVATESGQAVPEQCLLRGNSPAAQWIPNFLLQEACGYSFVDGNAELATLRELGVRECGHEELVACIQHCEGRWLQTLWREQDRRSAAFNDLYKSLLDAILEDPARLAEVQSLSMFPVAATPLKTLRDALFNEVNLCSSIGLYTAPWGAVPQSLQSHLVRCLEPSLELSSQSSRLLQLLGVEPVSEAELEAAAFRTVLEMSKGEDTKAQRRRQREADNFQSKTYWSALVVLRLSYLKGRDPELGWSALKGAAKLLSHSQQLVPAAQLRLRSFLGVELRLPLDIIGNICSIAGIETATESEAPLHSVDRAASPPGWLGAEQDLPPLESNLGWEVFMCGVFGCQAADPLTRTCIGGPPLPEGFVESFLRLGEILTSGQFWQRAAGSSRTLDYLQRIMHLKDRSEVALARRNFLRKLAVRNPPGQSGNFVLQDLFLQEVFQNIAGCYLPYIKDVPANPQVRALLQWCGVATEVDQFSLVKALRFARETEIRDLGFVSEIYRRLDGSGFNPGEEKLFLVPGKGFLSKIDCVWRPFKVDLLRKCCQLEILQDHYSRFGPGVRTALTKWIREGPETSAKALCEALIMAIECARVDTRRSRHLPGKPSISPQEAAAQLFPAAKAAIEELVKLCVGTCMGIDLIPPEPPQRVEDKRPETVVYNHFVQQRMIVVPGVGEGDAQCRILAMGEAYWEVAPELEGSPAQDTALKTHYGVGGNEEATFRFFTEILSVRPLLTVEQWLHICEAHAHAIHFLPSGERGPSTIEEGLKIAQVTGTETVPMDLDSAVAAVYQRLHRMGGPMEGPEHGAPIPDRNQGPRVWRHVGFLGRGHHGIPLFSANGAQPPAEDMTEPELGLLLELCQHFGIHHRQIAFAYDPSGSCVCRERMFLDLKYLPRARLLESQAGYHAVVSFWASKLAKMLQNLGQVPSAGAAAFRNRLLQMVLPGIFQADDGFQ